MITYAEYQNFVVGLMSSASTVDGKSKMATAAFGLTAESGEFLDHIKKILFHGADQLEHRQEMIKELGDIMFYVTFAASVFNSNVENLMSKKSSFDIQTNINVFYHLLGLAGVTGRYADITLKCILNGKDNSALLIDEMENVILYVSFAANLIGSNIQEAIEGNVVKLSSRYKNKTFTVEEFKSKEAAKHYETT